ncbi:MAG: DUF4166 domain-containing protein [Burkholderiales bacterium]|nr:DUF4166 domain-containing protein [Burkholderiales bacterium]
MNKVAPIEPQATENAVTRWFGPHFSSLHPMLQGLHRHGGTLRGPLQIEFGRGLGGWIGRRLARKLGIPTDLPQCGFVVDIQHEADRLIWRRQFENGSDMVSIFTPIGAWPAGYWVEATGVLQLRLTVDVVDGGWYWRPLAVRLAGMPLPMWLFPSTDAYKRAENGRYRFAVVFKLPLLGRILSYQGLLEADIEKSPQG